MNLYTVCWDLYDSCPLLIRSADEDEAIEKALDYWENIFGEMESEDSEDDDGPYVHKICFKKDIAEMRDVF